MPKEAKHLRFSQAWASVLICLLLSATPIRAGEKPPASSGAQVFALEEVSIRDCPEPARSQLLMGQLAEECGPSPRAGITYPHFQSSQPLYGVITFGKSLFDSQAGLLYAFAVDESRGTGTVYDRLYFDLNHDSDLTNDAAVSLWKDEKIQVRLDYSPEGVWTQTLLPQLLNPGGSGRALMCFAAPTARQGKIVLGGAEVEVVVSSLAGRYDRPMTGMFLTGRPNPIPLIGYRPYVNGAFYRLWPSPAGDKISVEPYTGPLGTFEIGAAARGLGPLSFDFVYLGTKDTVLDLMTCKQEKGRWSIPPGAYRPWQLVVRYGQRQIGLRMDAAQVDPKTAPPAVFPFHVRAGQSFVFDFSGKPQVVFKTPAAGQRVKAGGTLNVEAILLLPETGCMIAALDDTTKKTASIKLPDGRDFDLFASVDPKIKIVNSAGETVAEGEMPFG